MDEAFECLPVAVDLDATELDDRLRALLDPPHPAVVAAVRDDVLDGALDDAGRDDEVTQRDVVAEDAAGPDAHEGRPLDDGEDLGDDGGEGGRGAIKGEDRVSVSVSGERRVKGGSLGKIEWLSSSALYRNALLLNDLVVASFSQNALLLCVNM